MSGKPDGELASRGTQNEKISFISVNQAKTSSLEKGKMGKAENCCNLSFRTGNR
jgi:hypothetical protein